MANSRLPAVVLMVGLSGCSVHQSAFEIVDYRKSGQVERYQESFKEAYYDIDPGGQVDIVLRRGQPTEADPRREISQLIHIRTVWRSIPGDTVASRTQINATVSYMIVGGRLGTSFEGAGSVFFKENRRKDRLTGALDLALLQPTRKLAGGQPIFDRAQLQGTFQAKRNRRQVVHMLNNVNCLFGPRPPYQPPAIAKEK